MGDEETLCKVEYLDTADGSPEETNWIKRAGRCKVTYPNGHIFEGTYDNERVKQGKGIFIWMGKTSDEDETLIEKSKYDGNYKDGFKHGIGRMTYPNGDEYEGEWLENKISGVGTYKYKNGDIYSGHWLDGKKHGPGDYEFAADQSRFAGSWENGEFKTGEWKLKGAGVYTGEFKLGRPFGAGKFLFESGLTQNGSYVEQKSAEGEEEPPAEGEAPKPPNVSWKGQSIVSF